MKKVALVTGASSGIGKATAAALASAGYITYATARRPETVTDLAASGCRTLALDVTSKESMAKAVQTIEAESGPVSILINNAGYGEYGPLEEMALDAVRQEFETNVFGLLQMSQLVLSGMRRQGWGRIINISSMGGQMAFPGGGAYHASKYAVEALSDVLRYEVQPFGVDVVIIEPGFVRTQFGARIVSSAALQGDSGPYAGFKQALNKSFESMVNLPSSSAEDVAAVIMRAVQASRPRTRYKISFLGRAFPFLRRILPDRGWDALMHMLFADRPGKRSEREQAKRLQQGKS